MENPTTKSEIEQLREQLSSCEEKQERLKAINEELRLFMYKASHDLKSPFASVAGVAILMRRKLDPHSEEMQYFEQISGSMQKLQKTLIDLTEVSRISQENIAKQEINFEEIINEVLESLRNMPGFSKVKPIISSHYSGNCYGDKKILSSVFQNLIVNAIAYCNRKQPEPYYKIEINEQGDHVEITFSDNGIGIENELQDKVFDMFYRANEDSKGTGLGLYIVKKGIRRLGGDVRLVSEPMKGTTFYITLPLGK